MEKLKKAFGGINLTWPKLIIFAIVAGIYTAIMAILPIAKDTSFADITVTFEVWIIFGIFIIMNSKSSIDSLLKCFIFFLISQPLVYLIQVPFSKLGFGLFTYYRYWFIMTLLTIPMGFVGYYMKKDKWWGTLILLPMQCLLGMEYMKYLGETIMSFPNHILTTIFCLMSIIILPIAIFNDKKAKIIGLIAGIIILIVATTVTIFNKTEYNTTLLVSDSDEGVVFDDTYNVYLHDKKFGEVFIVYEENIEEFMVNARFVKTGKTEFTLESKNGKKYTYEIDVQRNRYDLKRISTDEDE